MKKVLMIAGSVIFLYSCGGSSDNKDKPAETTTTTTTAAPESKDPEAAKGLKLIAKSDCFTCHKLKEASVGPSYASVAAKYKVLNEATTDSIVGQIKNGGSGKWGSTKMLPHPAISKEDAESMAHYIMSITP